MVWYFRSDLYQLVPVGPLLTNRNISKTIYSTCFMFKCTSTGGLRVTGGLSINTGQFFMDMTVTGGVSVMYNGLKVSLGNVIL